jgi:hypothetical protein
MFMRPDRQIAGYYKKHRHGNHNTPRFVPAERLEWLVGSASNG